LKSLLGNVYFLAALIFGLTSLFSSFFVYRDIFSIWKTIEFIILIYLLAFIHSCRFSYTQGKTFFDKVIMLYTLYLMIAVVLAFIYPSVTFKGNHFQFFPIFPMINPNVLGHLSLIIFFYYFFNSDIMPIYRLMFLLITGILFVLAISRTAYLAFIFIGMLLIVRGFLKIAILKRLKQYLVVVFSAVIFSSCFLLINFSPIISFVSKGQSNESISTLSSRSIVWQASKLAIAEKPLLGYGLYAETRRLNKNYSNIFPDGKIKKKGISNTHGSLFEILLASGLIGSFLHLLLFFFTVLRSIYNIINGSETISNYNLIISTSIIVIFFRFLTGSAIAGFGNFTLFYLLFIGLNLIPSFNFHYKHRHAYS